MNEKDKFALQKANELCDQAGGVLLYFTRYGSHLYGTNTSSSDTDYKGVYLPNFNSMLMGKKAAPLGFKTTDEHNVKNSSDDIDLQLFPIQFWLRKLVRKGETEGIELLYSHTNKDAVLFIDGSISAIFNNKHYLFDPKNTTAFLGFAIGQARTYFGKAERFNIVNNINNFLLNRENNPEFSANTVFDEILEKFGHPTYCFELNSNDLRSIQICGKIHQGTISIKELQNRVAASVNMYGHRTKAAADFDNKDWKSLSHALKAILEILLLLETEQIEFPLDEKICTFLREVKLGNVDFDIVENAIFSGIDLVNKLRESFDNSFWGYNERYVTSMIRSIYNLHSHRFI